MAPESERANGTVWVSCAACNRNHKFGQCSQPAPANESTYSWRERRVQELEELLREMVKQNGVHSGECFSCDLFVRERGKHSADCPIPKAEMLLANSEQTRKGAKHE